MQNFVQILELVIILLDFRLNLCKAKLQYAIQGTTQGNSNNDDVSAYTL